MPLYLFQTAEGEVKDIFYHMNDAPSIGAEITDENGVKWKRIVTKPQDAIGVNVDPYDQGQFVRSLENKNETFGSTWDRAAELSRKREAKEGKDPVKEKYYKEYSETRKGELHPNQKKEKLKESLKEAGFDSSL